jgi:hypothetical protein
MRWERWGGVVAEWVGKGVYGGGGEVVMVVCGDSGLL